MAATLTFVKRNHVVPLGLSWYLEFAAIESLSGVDLTGADIRAQFRPAYPTALPADDPVLEFTNAGFYGVAPAWEVAEVFDVTDIATGEFKLIAHPEDFAPFVSPENLEVTMLWEVVVIDTDGHHYPVERGRVRFTPAINVS